MHTSPDPVRTRWHDNSSQQQGLLDEMTGQVAGDSKALMQTSLLQLEPGSEKTRDQAIRDLIETSFVKGFLSSSWLIHLVAVAASLGVMQLRIRDVYWSDEISWNEPVSRLAKGEVQSVLQFAAKIHEVLIMASLSAMALHVVRRMLLGDGVAYGLLAGAYQIGSVPYLFSSALWGPFYRLSCLRTRVLALVLAAGVIYANLVAPASAIIIIPSLDWWPLEYPYAGRSLPTYVTTSRDMLYPSDVKASEEMQRNCNNTLFVCPGGGHEELRNLMVAISLGGVDPITNVKMHGAETYRVLNATWQFSNTSNVALATTLHSTIGNVVGNFWDYVSRNPVGEVNKARRPRFESDLDDFKAPVVQVQCAHYSWLEAQKGMVTPHFDSSGMRNLSENGRDVNRYEKDPLWEVPERFWNYTREDLETETFEWFDAASSLPIEGPSLGAIATVPIRIRSTHPNGSEEDLQDSMILPCLVDARWVGVSMTYDPKVDNRLPSNISDLSVFRPFWDVPGVGPIPGGLPDKSITISPSWANLLNNVITTSIASERPNLTAMELYMRYSIMYSMFEVGGHGLSGFAPAWNIETANIPIYREGQDELEVALDDIARRMATIISLAIADGLSRVTYGYRIGVVLDTHTDGSRLGQDLMFRAGHLGMDPHYVPSDQFDDFYSLEWKVQRYGRGYSLREDTVVFAIAILSVHVVLVAIYALYTLNFRLRGGGWASSAWGGVHELMALALASPRPTDIRLMKRLMEGRSSEARVKVGVRADEFEMVVSDPRVRRKQASSGAIHRRKATRPRTWF